MLRKLCCLVSFGLILAGVSALAAGEGKILAAYGDAASKETLPPGWNFYWNANGSQEDTKGYAPLTFDEKAQKYGVMDETGAFRADRPNCDRYFTTSLMRDKDGKALFLIASYKMQNDSEGEIWINNGNMRSTFVPEGNILEIYLNDELKSKEMIKKDRFAQVFQKKLGKLKKGDTIRVALGPEEKARTGGGKFNFTIEDYPAGQNPGEPANIVSPPINAAVPQMWADGKIDKNYSTTHKAQCAEFLSKKSEIVFIGDSITTRWPAEILKERFGKLHPVNLGIGGDWIQNVIWRVENGVFDQVKPKLVVLLIGTNNIGGEYTPEEMISGINSIVGALNKKSPETKILILGILPRGKSINNNPIYEKIKIINASLSKLADGQKIFYLDVGYKLIEKDGSLSNDLFHDGLHITGKAYPIVADAIAPLVEKITGL